MMPPGPPSRYLALWLPRLPSERARRDGRAPSEGTPFALVEKQRGAMRIAAPDLQAARLGLEPGMMLADARGRVPELAAVPHDPAADAALLLHLARLCGSYSPGVAPDPPDGLMLDISGCAHLFGGEEAMHAAITTRIAGLGFTIRAARAATPDAARALARFGPPPGGGDVRALPVEALTIAAETHGALRRAGFRTIGDIAALPSAPLAARFGTEAVRLLDRLLGRDDPHIVPLRTRAPVHTEMRFAEPIARTGDMLDAIEALTEQAATRLAGRGEGGRAFAVRLHRSDGHVAKLLIETGAPTRDPALVLRLLRERIDSLADPLDPGFGYDSIDLAVPRTELLPERQPGLAGPEKTATGDIGPLLDRLAVRYGPRAVLRFTGADSHRPERAGGLTPVADAASAPTGRPLPTPEPGEPPLRPLLLLDPPQKVEVLAAVPDGPPRRFRWRAVAHHVVRQEGPERIAPEWWRRARGHDTDPGLSRDYYRVEDESGHRFWLFRHGLYGRETNAPDWYVHGLFA